MKVTLLANVSANGKVLVTENPHYHEPMEALRFIITYANNSKNIIIGRKTYDVLERVPRSTKRVFPQADIVVISQSKFESNDVKFVTTANDAMDYLKSKGHQEIIVGGGAGIYNLFIEKELVTDMYFNYIPVLVGDGGVLGYSETLSTQFEIKQHHILTPNILQVHYSRKG